MSFYSGGNYNFNAPIICIDIRYATEEDPYIVDMSFEGDFNKDEFFNLFKRLKVIVTSKSRAFDECEIYEEIILDDRTSPYDL